MNWKSHLEDSLEDGFYFTKKERSKTYVAGQNKIAEGFTISKEVAIVEANIYFCLLNKDMSEFFSATSWRADTLFTSIRHYNFMPVGQIDVPLGVGVVLLSM